MTSSTSSSSRTVAQLLALFLAMASGTACAGAHPAPRADARSEPYRIALFPAENMSASAVPVRGIDAQIARALAAAGLEVVTGDLVERFLERHRLRYTGGIDSPSAAAARDELGVEGVLLTSVQVYGAEAVPRLALTMRVVSASEEAKIVWIDGAARTGDDAPGLLGLGLIQKYADLEQRELKRLATSLVNTLAGNGRATPCPDERRFRPRIAFRSPRFDPSREYSVAVLPFVNQSTRRRAGDVIALEFTRQLAAVPRLHVLEPGVIRERLIRNRVVMEGGISVDVARLMLDSLHADLVLAGYVRDLGEGAGAVDFTVLALEREHGTVVWESTSHASGTDGVWFFGQGKISTSSAVACRMVRDTVLGMVGDSG
jgi:TolB-like protein